MLNGRKCTNNDFTSVSSKGLAVVDYCLISHTDLHMFDKFNITRASVLCQDIIQGFGFVPPSVPNHSVITWHIIIDYEIRPHNVRPTATYDKFDTRSIPWNFLTFFYVLA